MNYRKRFRVKAGTKVKLDRIDPAFTTEHDPKKKALEETEECVRAIDELQRQMYAERRHSLLIVLQGLDAAGKDGTIRHVLSGVNPQGCSVAGFHEPTGEELAHDFLWRIHPHAPARGQIAIFNRSHYEDVLVVRVHKLAPKSVWSRRYDLINDFERNLHLENDTTILKFFLHISKEEQLARFEQRLDDPLRQWKISESDYREREYWNAYTEAFEEVLLRTSTDDAPWFVIPSDHKWFRDLAISHIILETVRDMSIEMPKPTVDLAEIRRKYHEAIRGSRRRGRRGRG